MAKKKSNTGKSAALPATKQPRRVRANISRNLNSIIDAKMRQQFNRIDTGPAGLDFLECALNPFGEGRTGGAKSVAARVPDGAGDTIMITLTNRCTWAGSTATAGMVEVCVPNASNVTIHKVHYGNDPLDIGHSPTATSSALAMENSVFTALMSTPQVTENLRLVSAGLKVNLQSAPDDSSGTLYSYGAASTVQYGASSWNTYISGKTVDYRESKSVQQGMCVRTCIDPSRASFWGRPVQYAAQNVLRPVVVFTGLSATTVLVIEEVLHLEMKLSAEFYPYVVRPPAYEPEVIQMMHFALAADHVVEGHSFKSFLQAVGRMARKVLKYVADNPAKISTFAGSLLALT